MDRGKMRRIVLLLIAVSALIYGLQILIFHDVRNTAFYILQDFAFMPVTIAIATLVVGELIAAQEKKERQEKTCMLTSTFRLRGDYSRLSEEDIRHLDEDFSRVLKLMLMNWVSNARYLKETFPNYYSTAREKAVQSKWNIR